MQQLTRAMIFTGNEEGSEEYNAVGWARREYSPYPFFWHNGSTFGAHAFIAFVPEEKIGIVILSNLRGPRLASALGFQFIDNYFGKPDQNRIHKMLDEAKESEGLIEKISNPYPPMPLSNYEGVYHNPVYGNVIVTKKNESLEIRLGKNNLNLSLTQWDRDILTLEWPIADDSQDFHARLYRQNQQNENGVFC